MIRNQVPGAGRTTEKPGHVGEQEPRRLHHGDVEVEQAHDHPHHGELRPRPLRNDSRRGRTGQLSVQTRIGDRTAASRDDGTNDLLVGDVLRTNQLQERR